MNTNEKWETFCDESYYGLWRVRRVNFKSFESGFHVHSKEEAEGLCELLNKMERQRDEAREELEEAKRGCRLLANNASVWKERFKASTKENSKLRDLVEEAIDSVTCNSDLRALLAKLDQLNQLK